MKRLLPRAIILLAVVALIGLSSGITNAQRAENDDARPGAARLKQLFDQLAKSDWANDPDADEIRKLLDRVKQGKPLSPEQFAKLFEKIQMKMPGQSSSKFAKNHDQVRRAFRPIVKNAAKSTVVVMAGGKQVAAGTVVDNKGHVLTKASELRKDKKFSAEVTVKTADSAPRPAKIVGVSEEHDLALLEVDPKGLAPVKWHRSGQPPVGSWLATTGLGDDPVAVGVVSVAPRKIGFGGGF
ncbi:MAG: serine protease, partial [Pirellulales bacterium]|nr:serine protease [Pirellulales bacterium]